ncbi:unnamed protein product [Dovyalis caffra]|uniref:Response regulatory domain-containing protein n=1 Tax=Dovyalis caffra TaxID=77055 RepID=A0AAV1R7R4_9ROSI|nr:unnamed protein product [Dovyalis caffra]
MTGCSVLNNQSYKRKETATSNIGGSMGTQITALVVDDDRITQTIHCKLLNKLGIENQVATNGKEVVDLHCSGKRFDLIVMDRDMPIMNGIEATRKLCIMGISSMIIGMSSRSLEQETKDFVEAGLDDYQEKPLTSAKVISILHKHYAHRWRWPPLIFESPKAIKLLFVEKGKHLTSSFRRTLSHAFQDMKLLITSIPTKLRQQSSKENPKDSTGNIGGGGDAYWNPRFGGRTKSSSGGGGRRARGGGDTVVDGGGEKTGGGGDPTGRGGGGGE